MAHTQLNFGFTWKSSQTDTQKQKAFTDYCREPVLFVPSNKMGTEGTPRDPLLVSSKEDQNGFAYINKTSPLLKSTKWVLKSAMWLIFISWVSFLFLVPSDSVKQLYTKLVHATSGTLFGNTGKYRISELHPFCR